jgi:hypothetical protein
MIIGRLEFGIAKGHLAFGYQKGSCGCYLLDLGRFYITWLSGECK